MPLSERQLVRTSNALFHESTPLPAVRKKRNNEESRIQQAVVIWWHVHCKHFNVPECMLFAIPNGARRDPIIGAILKREGVKPGTSDLFLGCARGGFHGMFLEVKKPDGRLAPNQLDFMQSAHAQGYIAWVRYSYQECVDALDGYLKL